MTRSHDAKQIVLITGCSSGFGLLIAARLSALGYCVFATMRDVSKQNDLLVELSKRGGQATICQMDVINQESITSVVSDIITKHGRIDVLINNAGFGLGGFFEDLADAEIRSQMETNFFGVLNVTRAVVSFMRKARFGKIINISSVAGRCASPALSAYSASKWALEGFSESLYHELAIYGVKVVLVEPGSYPTKIFTDNAKYAKNFNDPNSPYFALSQRLKAFVLKSKESSTKDPEEVARLVEQIVRTKNPRLRYVSDFQSLMRIYIGKIIPPVLYNLIFRKVIYGNAANAL